MQRRAYAPSLAALLAVLAAAGLGGCTSGSAGDGSALDSKTGAAGASAAPPGRYSSLYQPCESVPRGLLEELLPGVASLAPEQRDRALRGTAAVTYDSTRRAGCTWKADGAEGSRHLTLDFERVVSYDPTVSDDDRAQEVFTGKETEAGLPSRTPGTADASGPGDAAPSATPDASDGPQAQTASPSPSPSSSVSGSESPSAPATPDELRPRALDGLGDVAFLNDVLAASGAAAQQRTVSVVFRTSNVLVTVRYTAQAARVGEVPDSKELQDKARKLARRLADRFDE
ncbi:DUF3558 domain-containing protein [Streptomyces sp. MUM 203J]|uniref:DUF3558 domain-containing protein n=1 Tax=Streptomyces sp. MUM 203J TaxID=2791990 RepID=UPI001F04DB08|nr:DUF3558 domain-containing protein [Streptomyces sp. MUM 203J]MCH0541382.1 DUF3558 domain-containing protein [Streptomyces sp. MUM 203J]